jgi:hypothetical protein
MTIQVNPQGADGGALSFDLRGPSGTVLPELVRLAWH